LPLDFHSPGLRTKEESTSYWVILPMICVELLVARHGGVDGAGPGVYASGEGLGVVEALVAEPHGDAERTGSVVAEDDDGGVGVELLVGARGDFAHGHEEGIGEAGGLVLPWFADVEEKSRMGLLALLGEGLDGDLGV
jgi:hypothetical protein